MNKRESKTKQKEFVKLLGEGYTARDIAPMIGVSEKTLGQWKKKLPQAAYKQLAAAVRGRLENAVSKAETTHTDIYNLTNSVAKLEQLSKFD